jgi:hypothetical protein
MPDSLKVVILVFSALSIMKCSLKNKEVLEIFQIVIFFDLKLLLDY